MSAQIAKQIIQYGYAGIQFTNTAIETGSSFYFETGSSVVAAVAALTSGLLSYTTTWYFQCPEIDRYFTEHHAVAKSEEDTTPPVTGSTAAWLYTLGRSTQAVCDNYFQMQAMLAWYEGLNTNQSMTLKRLPIGLCAGVLIYTLLCSIPFMLSNEIHETCEALDPDGAKAQSLPTHTLLSPYISMAKGWLNELIVWVGSITHSLEHSTSLFMMIPPQALVKLYTLGQLYFILGLSGLGLIGGIFFAVHLVQTLFFEGYYSHKNLSEMTDEPKGDITISNSLQYWGLNITSSLLWTQSILHGLDDSLPIVALLSTLGFGYMAYAVGLATTIISALGTQMSEVYRAGEETEEVLSEYRAAHGMGG